MEQIIREHERLRELLDDSVAMCEALRCLRDKGAEEIDCESITLTTEIFDKCFPDRDWQPVETGDGPIGISFKTAEYRGFRFWCFMDTEDITGAGDPETSAGQEKACTGSFGLRPQDDRERPQDDRGEELADGDR